MGAQNKDWSAVRIMLRAMDEYRGLDRSLIIEMEEGAGDIIGCCDSISIVLRGFLALSKDEQNKLIVAGAMSLSRSK